MKIDSTRASSMVAWGLTVPKVLVVGDIMLDRYLLGTCERISPEAPVQVVDVRETRHHLGGAGNVVRNVLALEAQVHVLSVIGNDPAGTEILHLLRSCGAGSDGVIRDDLRRTTEKTRIFAVNQQVVRYDVEVRSPISAVLEEKLIEHTEKLHDVDAVIVSDYGKGVVTERVCRSLVVWAKQRQIPVLCDPKGRNYSKYAGSTVLTPNRKEASEATGIVICDDKSLLLAGQHLRETFALEHCVITLSEDGMALFSDDGVHHYTPQAREVFDVTGAGDTVVATMAVALAAGRSVLEACKIANVAAGIKVAKLGAATVSLSELNNTISGDAISGLPHGLSPEKKIKNVDEISMIAAEMRISGRRIVFTNGCFDILHRGHAEYLQKSAELGDVLVVGLNSDRSIERIKGNNRPIHRQDDRAFLLATLACVDFVVIFDDETPMDLIATVSPSVLVKGGDYTPDEIVGADFVRSRGGIVRIVPFVEGYSTSNILRQLVGEERPLHPSLAS